MERIGVLEMNHEHHSLKMQEPKQNNGNVMNSSTSWVSLGLAPMTQRQRPKSNDSMQAAKLCSVALITFFKVKL